VTRIEGLQLPFYAAAIVLGLAAGSVSAQAADAFADLLWPVLAALLFATFLQVTVRQLPAALRDHRFLGASLAANFVAAPAAVALLTWLVPLSPAATAGVVFVLVAPCTDWFTSFTHLGKGDTRLAVAATPLLLAVQLPLLPLFLWLLTDLGPGAIPAGTVALAIALVIVLPLLAAAAVQELPRLAALPARAGRAVVPLLALTLFLVAGSQVTAVREAGREIGEAVLVFVFYLAVALVIAAGAARLARLDVPAARTLAFNLGTRNSFVVLPLALTLPSEYALAVPVIAAQSLVELCGMLVYLRIVPAWLFRDRAAPQRAPAPSL
jgi:ACR3 family arsenite efflux pump ArsB